MPLSRRGLPLEPHPQSAPHVVASVGSSAFDLGTVALVSKVPESVVEAVVGEVSASMSDPGYAQVRIGSYAQSHPDAGRFITPHLDDLGGGEAVMRAVFHAEVLNECFRRHIGRSLSPVGFDVLDRASEGDSVARFADRQPALASYVASNVDDDAMRKLLSLVGLAMDEMT